MLFHKSVKPPEIPGLPLTLERGQVNQQVRIVDIWGGWGIRQHLNQLGLHVGDVIQVKRECRYGGPVLIGVNHSEIAIGNRMARKIQIQVVDERQH